MPAVQYKLGRDAVASLPGVSNDDIRDVTINVTAEELDVTTFLATAITEAAYMPGLTECTIDVVCMNHTAEVGDSGTQDVAGLPSELEATVLNISDRTTPRGTVEYTISYGLSPASGA
jgi:hypothetical protein